LFVSGNQVQVQLYLPWKSCGKRAGQNQNVFCAGLCLIPSGNLQNFNAATQLKKVMEKNLKDATAEKYLKNVAYCMVKGRKDWTRVERITSR
jgi:hypothetical protein